jgi:hypothetical protein
MLIGCSLAQPFMRDGSSRHHWPLPIAHCSLIRSKSDFRPWRSMNNGQLAMANPTCADPNGRRLV